MRRFLRTLLGLAIAIPVVGAATPAAGIGTEYSFRLKGANTAVAPVDGEHCKAGDWIALTGSGEFDPVAGTIEAEGTFKHYNADGTLHERGTWEATAFVSFVDFGGPKASRHGGRLELVVTHLHEGMEPHTGLSMTVTSSIAAPAGTVWGVTVGPFTVPTGGDSVFAMQ